MKSFMVTLLLCSVTMSALALFYMAVTPYLARYYSVTGRYYSWLVLVIGLIIPFRPQFGRAIVKVTLPDSTAAPAVHLGGGSPLSSSVPAGHTLPAALPDAPWLQITAAVWLTGLLLFLAFHVIKHIRFMKLTARWSVNVTDEKTLALLQDLKTQMGISKPVGLLICDTIGSPMMTGLAVPRILLPVTDFSEDELRFILKHELVHYKRKDLWYKCLILTATALHWFNPVVYVMAKAIDTQCELSCDAEVVRGMGADTRLSYSETIIGVIRYRSKLKTALSTHFYGGKKGMKERIFSIMDMKSKKTGLAVLCGALTLTLGTGFAFAADAKAEYPPKIIQEDIKEDIMVSYGFLPDPQIYSQYSSYGIAVSDDGTMLLYNGQRIRLFVDEHSDNDAFFFDEAGTLDLSVTRNAAGSITGIKSISRAKAQEYRSSFFADDIRDAANAQQTQTAQHTQAAAGRTKYDQYSPHGITLSSDGNVLRYNGQRVKLLADQLSDGSYETFWTDEAGTVNLSVVRDASGKITAIENISEEKAQEYRGRLKTLFPEE